MGGWKLCTLFGGGQSIGLTCAQHVIAPRKNFMSVSAHTNHEVMRMIATMPPAMQVIRVARLRATVVMSPDRAVLRTTAAQRSLCCSKNSSQPGVEMSAR